MNTPRGDKLGVIGLIQTTAAATAEREIRPISQHKVAGSVHGGVWSQAVATTSQPLRSTCLWTLDSSVSRRSCRLFIWNCRPLDGPVVRRAVYVICHRLDDCK